MYNPQVSSYKDRILLTKMGKEKKKDDYTIFRKCNLTIIPHDSLGMGQGIHNIKTIEQAMTW